MGIHAGRTWIIGVILVLEALFSQPSTAATTEMGRDIVVPAQVFAGEPRGPYHTGTFEALWINAAMDDPSTKAVGDARKLMVQVWYPATLPKHPRYAPYAISPQLYGRDHWVHDLAHVRTQSALDAPFAVGVERFPVLIYNHGAGNPHFSGTSQTEFLASHGYVVVSVGHPDESDIERFPDGTSYRHDGSSFEVEMPMEPGRPLIERVEYAWAHSDLGLLVKDISFVLDRLEASNADPRHRLYKRLDLGRIGALGWSLGGFLSLQAGRDEPRIKAVASLDGMNLSGLTGPHGVATLGSERPLLLIFADRQSEYFPLHPGAVLDEEKLEEMEVSWAASAHFWTMLRRSTASWYYVTIARTDHAYYADRILFFPERDPAQLHPRAAHEIINEYLLEFFDRHLSGKETHAQFLSGEKSFADVRLLRRSQ